jgi:hypothetical protein
MVDVHEREIRKLEAKEKSEDPELAEELARLVRSWLTRTRQSTTSRSSTPTS